MNQQTLENIVNRLATDLPDTSQDDQIRILIKMLVENMGVDHAFIARNVDDVVTASHAYDFYYDKKFIGPMEYKLEHTPCDHVINENKVCHHPFKVQELFPHDEDLQTLNIHGYAGIPVVSSRGESLGHIVLMSSGILQLTELQKDLLRIFAYKAAYVMENAQFDA